MNDTEASASFDCFGCSCVAFVSGEGELGSAQAAVEKVRSRLQSWHVRFSRFLPASELSLLNSDPAEELRVSPLMARLADAVLMAGSASDGLVDATLIDEIETAGYATDLSHTLDLSLALALALAPERRPAAASRPAMWRQIEVHPATRTVKRPPGVKLDSGGLGKGLFADVLAETLAGHASFAISCGGDVSIGGAAGLARSIHVESPFDGSVLHTFECRQTGVATSGIGRRSWLDRSGRPAHHLLDPSSGKPAFTGVVQVTALAPSALAAEIYAKATVLSGPLSAPGWLPYGGVIVLDDGSHRVLEPPAAGGAHAPVQLRANLVASSEPPVASPAV
jgi:thiamine biosynthesis lipoprotein